MDWIYFFGFVYLVVSTPFAFLGLLSVYVLVSAFVSARVDRSNDT